MTITLKLTEKQHSYLKHLVHNDIQDICTYGPREILSTVTAIDNQLK